MTVSTGNLVKSCYLIIYFLYSNLLTCDAFGFIIFDQGIFPVAISNTVHPTLQISEYLINYLRSSQQEFYLPKFVCFITSGAIQFTVPLIEGMYFISPSTIEEILFAVPKSANLHIPLLSTRTFAPFMSLWIVFLT